MNQQQQQQPQQYNGRIQQRITEMEHIQEVEVPKQIQKIQEVKDSKPANDDLSERELFKSEKTFNFPMDIGDDIFDITETMPSAPSIKKEEKKF